MARGVVIYNQFKNLLSLGRAGRSALNVILKKPYSVTHYISQKGIIGRQLQQLALRVTEPKHLLSGIRIVSSDLESVSVEASLHWSLRPSDYIKMAEFGVEAYWRNFPETNQRSFIYSEIKFDLNHVPAKRVYARYSCAQIEKENFILKLMMHGRENLEFIVNFFDEKDHLCATVSGRVGFRVYHALSGKD